MAERTWSREQDEDAHWWELTLHRLLLLVTPPHEPGHPYECRLELDGTTISILRDQFPDEFVAQSRAMWMAEDFLKDEMDALRPLLNGEG